MHFAYIIVTSILALIALKDPSLGIITDIVDGARPTTDIIF